MSKIIANLLERLRLAWHKSLLLEMLQDLPEEDREALMREYLEMEKRVER